MDKKAYISPISEIQEVLAKHLLNTPGISGTGSGSSTDGDSPLPAPRRRIF